MGRAGGWPADRVISCERAGTVRVLVAEDDEQLAASLRLGLRENGMDVDLAHDGDTAARMASSDVYDVIIMDIMLPSRSGFDVIRELRAQGLRTPVLCLTARDSLNDKLAGFALGADDYLVKPFEFLELLARVRVLARRPDETPGDTALKCADLELDPATREVRRAGRRIELTPREYSLLLFLMRRQGSVASRMSILEGVWGLNHDSLATVVDVSVNRLRNKVDYPFAKHLIQTVRGVGYCLTDEESRQ
jgi:DNA-binding response OmpR family regulator